MSSLETLAEHAQWLFECQRDAEVQEAIDLAIAEIARLRKAIKTHRDAEGGGIHTYSWYDKELYKALGEQE